MTVLNFPSNPTVGQEYALNGVVYTWDSQKWTASEGGSTVSVEVGDTAPLNPSDGDLWWDSSKESGRLYVFYTDENSLITASVVSIKSTCSSYTGPEPISVFSFKTTKRIV